MGQNLAIILERYQKLKETYKYQCVDRSIITPHFKKRVVTPLVPYLPLWISANMISFVSCLFLWLALGLAAYTSPSWKGAFLVAPMFFLFYAVGDVLDGMQASRTGTGSPLGEFCDHFLDAFATGLICGAFLLFYRVDGPYLCCGMIFCAYLVHAATIYEQFKTGWLRLDAFGSMEALLLVGLTIAAGFHPGVFSFFVDKMKFGYSPIEMVFIANILCMLIAFVKILQRVGGLSVGFMLFLLSLGGIFLIGLLRLTPTLSISILILYSIGYICNLMYGHLVDGVERKPDFLVPLALLVTLGIGEFYSVRIIPCIILYLVFLVLYSIARTFFHLRKFWVWTNPRML